jgi:hypothetical protein
MSKTNNIGLEMLPREHNLDFYRTPGGTCPIRSNMTADFGDESHVKQVIEGRLRGRILIISERLERLAAGECHICLRKGSEYEEMTGAVPLSPGDAPLPSSPKNVYEVSLNSEYCRRLFGTVAPFGYGRLPKGMEAGRAAVWHEYALICLCSHVAFSDADPSSMANLCPRERISRCGALCIGRSVRVRCPGRAIVQ